MAASHANTPVRRAELLDLIQWLLCGIVAVWLVLR
jgi:hypothetical protein